MADKLHVAQVAAIDDGNAATPERRKHAVAADRRRSVQRAGVIGRHRVVAGADVFRLLPRQAPDADDLRLERIADIERPDHALVPALGVARQQREIAFAVDTETVRAAARHVVEADLPGLLRILHIENVQAAAAILAFVAGKLFGIDVEQIVADETQLMAVHARRRAEFSDLVRFARVGNVMDGEAFGAVVARAADRADIGKALFDLDQTAAAPGRGRIMTEQPEIFGFFWNSLAHGSFSGKAPRSPRIAEVKG